MMQAGIFEQRDKWTGAIVLSAGLHLLLAVAIIVAGIIRPSRGQNWGGPTSGGSIEVGMVKTVSLPLPAPRVPTENIVATDNKGVSQSVPAKPEEEPKAIPIPDVHAKNRPPKTSITPAPQTPRPVAPANDNVVHYGGGGQPTFTTGSIQGGFKIEGDFGSRFAWYVEVIKSKVSTTWYQVEVSPGAVGHRAFVSFDVGKDGAPSNVQLEQSSGIPSLDQSAMRVLQRIDTFGPLPPGYSGTYLHVELWFNYQR